MSTDRDPPTPAALPGDLLAGSTVAFVKRIPRGFDYGLDGYAIERFAAHFRRYGAAVAVVDEARADAAQVMLALCRDPGLLLVHSFNGAGSGFRDAGTGGASGPTLYQRFGVPFLARASNTFFAENSRAAILAPTGMSMVLLRDRNSLAAAERLAPPGTMTGWLMGGALEPADPSPPSGRRAIQDKDIPLLVATRALDPQQWRASARARLGGDAELFDAVLEAMVFGPHLCLASTALAVLVERGRAQDWPRNRLFDLLALVNGTAMAIRRHRLLELTAPHPAVYVFDSTPPPIAFHPRSVVLPRMENTDLVGLIARSRGYLCFNPNGMAGAFSERIGQAVERGTIPLLQENAVTAELFAGGGGLAVGSDDDAMGAAIERLSDTAGLQDMADAGHARMRQHHTVEGFVGTILAAAARRAPDGRAARLLRGL